MEKNIQESPVQQEPKGKSNGCLIALGIFLFLIVLLCVGVYLGYKKIMNMVASTSLGVEYSQADYDSLMASVGADISPDALCIDCTSPEFSDPNEVKVTVTNAQASAAFEYVNQYMSIAKISGTQIKMSDGKAELTTNLTYQGKTFPLYMSGTISKTSENTITGEVFDLKAGGLNLPSNISSLVEEGLLRVANEKLESAGDTVRIDKLELTDGGLIFEGLVPTKAK
jgi:hypothetical protein